MEGESPHLRVVGPDERAPLPVDGPSDQPDPPSPLDQPRSPGDGSPARVWVSAAVPIAIAVSVLVVALAVTIRLLTSPGGAPESSPAATSRGASDATESRAADLPASTPASSPSSLTSTTSTAPTTLVAPTQSVPPAAPTLVEVPLGGPGATVTAPPAPVAGTVRVRIFNGYTPAGSLDVWAMGGEAPVRYGTVGLGRYVEASAGGRLLPSGVELRLRFARVGTDPSATPDPNSGPWEWNFTPADGSSQTLVLSPNPGLRILRIDNERARSVTPVGTAHVVPAVFHLVLEGTRNKRWAAESVGCLGPTTLENVEFDVVPGTALKLSSADDPECSSTVAGPVRIDTPGTFAVVGMGDDAAASLVVLPL